MSKQTYITKEVLIELSQSDMWQAQFYVASHKDTPPEVLDELLKCKDSDVLRAVASNRNTSEDVLIKLSKIDNSAILLALARNQSSPVEVLVHLYKIGYENLRFFVEKHSKFDTEEFKQLMLVYDILDV